MAGCSLPQGLLLPDVPASDNRQARAASSASHGAEGRSSARGGFLWGSSDSQRPSSADRPNGDPAAARAEVTRDGVTLNLVDAPIPDAARAVLGDILGVNYTVDNRIKGSVTIATTRPVRQDAVLDIFNAVLRGQGAQVVAEGELYKVVPANEVAAAGARVRMRGDGRGFGPGAQVYVVPLKYVAAAEMEQVLKSVAPEGGVLRVDATRNLLMLAGTRGEISAMTEVIDLFDVDALRGMSFAVFPVDAADPNAVAQELDTVFGNDTGSPYKGSIRFVPNRRLRAVLAMSSRPEYLRRADDWMRRLQATGRATERQLFSYKVRNRPPAVLAELLQRVYGAEPGRAGGPGAGPRVAVGGVVGGVVDGATDTRVADDRSPFSSGVSPGGFAGGGFTSGGIAGGSSTGGGTAPVLVDPSRSASAGGPGVSQTGLQPGGQPALPVDGAPRGTIGGPTEERGSARALISVVPDHTNRMLLITATREEYKRIVGILERIDVQAEQVLLEATIAEVTLNDNLRLGLKWFLERGQQKFTFTDSLIGAIAPTFPGFSYFFNSLNTQIVLDALSNVTDVNIVSSPTLTVLDGQRAVLQVGDEVPIITQQAVSVVTPGAPVVNSVTYRNTGVILAVVPHVHENGRVVLEIEQEVSEVGATTSSSINSPTFQQRRIKTTVAVRDGESLALGGLMQDRSSLARDQIPIVGEIPVVGNLFKSKDDRIRRTELLIIMTPRVVRDANQVRQITDEFRDRLNLTLRPQRQGPPAVREKVDRIQR
jgi:general secretion pathway protein D